jgi:hypothetical protein
MEKNTIVYFKNRSKKVLTYYVNPQLKEIMEQLDINENITYYYACNSLATVLRFNNISIETIHGAVEQKDIKSTISCLNWLPDNKLYKILEDVFKIIINKVKIKFYWLVFRNTNFFHFHYFDIINPYMQMGLPL